MSIDIERIRRLAFGDDIRDIPSPGITALAVSLLRDALTDGRVFTLGAPLPDVELTPADKAGPHPFEVYAVIAPAEGEPFVYVVCAFSSRSVGVFMFRPAPVEEALEFWGGVAFNPSTPESMGLPAVPVEFEPAVAVVAVRSVGAVRAFLAVLNAAGTRRDVIKPDAEPRHGRPHQPHDGGHIRVTWSTPIKPHQQSDPRGGHHSGPVPHERRAHLRHLASGKVVPVRTSVVNAHKGPIEPRDSYEVPVG